jgi:FAD/FMN-containing dehydrogenase/Fe-S oxidoreductase
MATAGVESDTRELVEDLRHRVGGEVRFDKISRALYSTDASIYQIEPIGVVLPRDVEDVVAVVETAARHGVSVLPRGGGTSLAGQTVGQSVVIDFSKYMRNLVELNVEEGWVRTQPGIILDELNHLLRPSGVLFAPDPSTSNRGNVGGALGNNSCGSHSIKWGKTIDHTLELDVVLSNGETTRLAPIARDALNERMRGEGFERDIFRTVVAVGESSRQEVQARFPKIMRRVSGYNLDEFERDADFNMARFVVGSEGTLVTITEAKMRVVPIPAHKALAVIHFRELAESLEATVVTLELQPAAVELIGSMILRQARSNLEYSRMMDFVEGDPEALLVVELTGDSEAKVEAGLDLLETRMKDARLGYAFRRLVDPLAQEKVWAVRKAGLGLMMNIQGAAKPLPFVEDTAVAPEKLPEFVRRFDEIVREHGTTAGYYGHASVGCLHIRPLIDLKRREGVQRMTSIAEAVSDLVLEFGGAMSGEHGDGLVRSGFIQKMFGPALYEAFRDVKHAFDPNGIMNPGKIIDPPPMTENLRTDPGYTARMTETALDFTAEGGLDGAADMCNGQGACRKVLGGTMCPSYMVTRDEEHSTRGRANALRAAMSGTLPTDALTSKRLYDVLDLCLECKACKAECPSNVDMAKLKYEFLDRYHRANGQTLRNLMFGNIAMLSRWGSFFAPVSNWLLGSAGVRDLLEKQGVDPRRTLPPFAKQTFRQWFKARGGSPTAEDERGQAVLFPDTFTNYNHPEIGIAAVKVIESLGYQVVLPPSRCCGRPMLSAGMMDRAKRNARYNVGSLIDYVAGGAKIVGLEPSCILSFRDDYKDLLPGVSGVNAVADSTMLIDEFVTYAREKDGATLKFRRPPGKVLFHGHCHQKALVGTQGAMQALDSVPGCDAEEIKSGCCGMAGSFGFESEHYEVSMKAGEQVLFPAVRGAGEATTVVADGVSCRQQIQDGTGRRARHLVETLADAL